MVVYPLSPQPVLLFSQLYPLVQYQFRSVQKCINKKRSKHKTIFFIYIEMKTSGKYLYQVLNFFLLMNNKWRLNKLFVGYGQIHLCLCESKALIFTQHELIRTFLRTNSDFCRLYRLNIIHEFCVVKLPLYQSASGTNKNYN